MLGFMVKVLETLFVLGHSSEQEISLHVFRSGLPFEIQDFAITKVMRDPYKALGTLTLTFVFNNG